MVRFPFVDQIFFWSPRRAGQICGTLRRLFDGCRDFRWCSGHVMKLTTNLHLVLTLTVSGALPPPFLCLSGVLRDNSPFALSQHLISGTSFVSIILSNSNIYFSFILILYSSVWLLVWSDVFPPDFSTNILCKFVICQCVLRVLPVSPSLA